MVQKLDPATRAHIKKILDAHVGVANAIHAKEIARQVGIKENATRVVTRGYITDIIRKDGLPVGSTVNAGYFIIETKEELYEYVTSLEKRALEIQDRKARVIEAFEAKTGIDIDVDEEDEPDP